MVKSELFPIRTSLIAILPLNLYLLTEVATKDPSNTSYLPTWQDILSSTMRFLDANCTIKTLPSDTYLPELSKPPPLNDGCAHSQVLSTLNLPHLTSNEIQGLILLEQRH